MNKRHLQLLTMGLRVPILLLIAVFVPVRLPAQVNDQNPEFRIQVNVDGVAVDDAKAAEKKKKTEWIELRSRNFLVAGDADLSDIRQAASEAELFRSQFAQLFPRAKETSSVPTRIIVFRDKQSIRQFGRLNEDGTASDKTYLRPGSDVNYIVLTAGDQMSRDIVRDFVRLLTRDSISPVPVWFQEGLGEYFSSYELGRMKTDRMIKIGLDDYKLRLKEKELIPLSVLFNVSSTDLYSMDSETRKFFASQSCALFEYLLQSRRIGSALSMINSMAEGEAAAESFRKAFKLPLSTFEENFKRHIQFSKLRGWNVTFTGFSLDPNKKLIAFFYANEPEPKKIPVNFDTIRATVEVLPVRLITEAQTEAYRGDLLLHEDRLIDAESRLQNAIKLDDRQASAFMSLGAVKAAQHEFVEAQTFIDKALRLDPGNYLAYYYAASLIRKEAEEFGSKLTQPDLEEIQGDLIRSVKLSPEFVETSEMLAETLRLLHGDINVAMRLLMDGLKRSPGRESLLMEMARVTAEGDQKPTSAWMLQRLIFSGSGDDRLRQNAQELLDSLKLTADQKHAFGDFSVNESSNGASQGISVRLTSKDDRKKLAKLNKADNPGKIERGIITKVDCSKGITIYLTVNTGLINERIEKLHTDTPEQIDWTTDNGQTINFIACGETARTGRAVVTYKPKSKTQKMGEPLTVEYLRLSE